MYTIGYNCGSTEAGGELAANQSAGIPGYAQENWNNLNAGVVVADRNGRKLNTSVVIVWHCNGFWASRGRGENNNLFTGGNRALMTGYFDTGNATTSTVKIMNIPSTLTRKDGYTVVVYFTGGLPFSGGGYWVEDSSGKVLTDKLLGNSLKRAREFELDPGKSHNDTGNYLLFGGLKESTITINASTANGLGWAPTGSSPRAPINAIQLVPGNLLLDSDKDGLADYEEAANGTDPGKEDTDGDLIKDGVEIAKGHDPLDESSFPVG